MFFFRMQSLMSYADYVKIRTLSFEGVTNLDRPYLFALNYCKIKALMFRLRNLVVSRIGATTAGKNCLTLEKIEVNI